MKRNNEFEDSIDLTEDFSIEEASENITEEEFSDEEENDSVFSEEEEAETEDELTDDPEMSDADDYTDEDFDIIEEEEMIEEEEELQPRKHIAGKIGLAVLALIVVFAVWALGTNSGRGFCMKFVAKFVHQNAGTVPEGNEDIPDIVIPDDEQSGATISIDESGDTIIYDQNGEIIKVTKEPRSEDYVTTYLIFGIEQIDGAANTDAIMLISINTKDNTIKLTSLLRDTYVDIPGWDKNKLNSAYAKGAHGAETGAEARTKGAALLIRTIEQTYDIKISGYACVNFDRFESIIDRLGGLDIELGAKEANYLNTTNYISNPDNRNVHEGWNHLNGNQVMGYVRVRKCVTLGGANNDYGRTVRQRRVINAIINKYKSTKLTDLLSLTKDCLGYVYTNLTETQIEEALTMIVNNGIYTTKSMRLPADELFYDSDKEGIFNGTKNVTYTLVIDDYLEENIELLHRFVFLDPEEEEADTATEGANGSE